MRLGWAVDALVRQPVAAAAPWVSLVALDHCFAAQAARLTKLPWFFWAGGDGGCGVVGGIRLDLAQEIHDLVVSGDSVSA